MDLNVTLGKISIDDCFVSYYISFIGSRVGVLLTNKYSDIVDLTIMLGIVYDCC